MFTDSMLNMMSLLVTEDCINCGACEEVCPSKAVNTPGKDYKINSKKKKALSNEHYYIISEKCNECKGIYDEPECVSVCPMDAIKKIKS